MQVRSSFVGGVWWALVHPGAPGCPFLLWCSMHPGALFYSGAVHPSPWVCSGSFVHDLGTPVPGQKEYFFFLLQDKQLEKTSDTLAIKFQQSDDSLKF